MSAIYHVSSNHILTSCLSEHFFFPLKHMSSEFSFCENHGGLFMFPLSCLARVFIVTGPPIGRTYEKETWPQFTISKKDPACIPMF